MFSVHHKARPESQIIENIEELKLWKCEKGTVCFFLKWIIQSFHAIVEKNSQLKNNTFSSQNDTNNQC